VQENRRGASKTETACIDAETLAAWADGGLPQADAAVVETHLADCDRCTAMLATFVRTAPEAPVVESLWKRWHLRWLVPAATAATVAALYVLVPRPASQITMQRPAPGTESQAFSSGAPAAPATPPSPLADAREQAPPAAATPAQPSDTLAKREESAPAPRQPASERRTDADTESKRLQAVPLTETLAAAPPPAREADRAEARTADAQSERFSPQVPLPSAAPGAPPAAVAAQPGTTPSPQAGGAATFSAAPAARARAIGGAAANAAPVLEVVSPDPMTRWRVVGIGQVERSTNGGARWERATLPEAATLTGGSSPSPTVCWLVGRTGAIYVTTDGLRFVRVPFGERTDFVSVQAIDGRRATVVTIDGRTMRTDDQGATWMRINP
jgi:hypothetical protein